jgi:DNA-3-methyladenine glycosylase II
MASGRRLERLVHAVKHRTTLAVALRSKRGKTIIMLEKRTVSRKVSVALAPSMSRITSEAALVDALTALLDCDRDVIGDMLKASGTPPLRSRPQGLEGLAWIVISQQVSTASARAIYARLCSSFKTLDTGSVLAASEEQLKACGLSAPKIRTLRAIAAAEAAGEFDYDRIAQSEPEAARAELVAVHGVGPWTADIYLLFCLGHPDVFPAGDLALQEAVRIALGLRQRPDAAKLERISRRWRPWRAVAARLLWAYYGVVGPAAKNRSTAGDSPAKSRLNAKAQASGAGRGAGRGEAAASKPEPRLGKTLNSKSGIKSGRL